MVELLLVFGVGRLTGGERCPEHVDAPSCERDDGLVIAFSFGVLAGVADSFERICERIEGRVVEHTLEPVVGISGALQVGDLAGLVQDWRQPGGGKCSGRSEAGEIACLGEELCGQHDAHAGQVGDDGPVRAGLDELTLDRGDGGAAGGGFFDHLADRADGGALSRQAQVWTDQGGEVSDIG